MVRRSKRAAMAIAGGALAGTVVMASAASLGTLNVQTLGASSTVVASCDTAGGISASWNQGASPVYSGNATASLSTYNVTIVRLSSIDAACDGLNYKLTLADNTGTTVGAEATGTITPGGTTNVTVPTPANSKSIVQMTLVIYG